MTPPIHIIKGLHPGLLIKRELEKQGLGLEQWAAHVKLRIPTARAILQGKRLLSARLAARIEAFFGWESGLLSRLQDCWAKEQDNAANQDTAVLLCHIRRAVFWDADIKAIDMVKHRNAIIRRVLTRGDADEIALVRSYFGLDIYESVSNS